MGRSSHSAGRLASGMSPIQRPALSDQGCHRCGRRPRRRLLRGMTSRHLLRVVLVVALAVPLTGGCAMIARASLPRAPVEADAGIEAFIPISTSDDGRYVAFASSSSTLVGGDTNGVTDGFVRDRTTGTTERVSVGAGQGNGASLDASISGDGRYVALTSVASNLVASDNNAAADVFVRDRFLATTSRASLSSAGVQGNGASGTPAI